MRELKFAKCANKSLINELGHRLSATGTAIKHGELWFLLRDVFSVTWMP